MPLRREVVDDAIVADPTAPGGWLSLEALDVSPERIGLHKKQRGFNASLFFWRKPLEVFLCGSGEKEIPHGSGIELMILHRPAERQPGHGGAQRVQLLWVAPRDSVLQSKRGAPPGRVRIGSWILSSALLQIAAPSPAARKWS
jgi:hypothetical protein